MPPLPRRQPLRLPAYDYTQAGAYFVTLCTHQHQCLFGEIVQDAMRLNAAGRVVVQCWQAIPEHFPQLILDCFVVMPNHVHGILLFRGCEEIAGANGDSPLRGARPKGTSNTLGSVVRGFKIGVTKWFRQNSPVQNVWQRNFYEHVIRDEPGLTGIREYIANNPLQWRLDRENPSNFRGEGS